MRLRYLRFILIAVAFRFTPALADGTVSLDFRRGEIDVPTFLYIATNDNLFVNVHNDPGSGSQTCGFFGLDADGTLLVNVGTQGRVLLEDSCAITMVVLADNTFVLTATPFVGPHRLEFRNASGALTKSIPLFPAEASIDRPLAFTSLSRKADTKLMLAGRRASCGVCGESYSIVARLNADGSSDSTFANGFLRRDLGLDGQTGVRSLVQLPTGEFVSTTAYGSPGSTAISRYLSDGVDFSFGANGVVAIPFDHVQLVADGNGKMYLIGPTGAVMRLGVDGTVDGSYSGAAGQSNLEISGGAIDSTGRLLIFGRKNSPLAQAYVARFETTGTLDASFNGGSSAVSFSGALGSAACYGGIQSQDRPVIACQTHSASDPQQLDVSLARLLSSGELDVSFGAGQTDSDTLPDPISFAEVSVPFGTALVSSASAIVTGIDAGTELPVSVTGAVEAQLSVGCSSGWTRSTFVRAGQRLCVRLDAPIVAGGTATAIVQLGTASPAEFTVRATNTAADSIPDAFSFVDQTNVAPGAVVNSNVVTISGITGYTTATATNGYFSIDCAPDAEAFTSNRITAGVQICLRHTASATPGGSTTTTLNVGGVTASFTSTTAPASGGGDGKSNGGGGSFDWITIGLVLSIFGISRKSLRRSLTKRRLGARDIAST